MLQSLQVSIDWNIEETIRRSTQPEKLDICLLRVSFTPPLPRLCEFWYFFLFSLSSTALLNTIHVLIYTFVLKLCLLLILFHPSLSQTTTEKCCYNFGFPSRKRKKKPFFLPLYTLSYCYFWVVVVVVVGICRRRAEWCVLPCRAPCRNRNRGWRRCWNPTCPVRRLTGS